MKVRNKLFIAMALLVFFMAGVFFTISHWYSESQFKQYVQAVQLANGNQWARFIAYYYTSNHNSWVGIDRTLNGVFSELGTIKTRGTPEYLLLKDSKGNVIVQLGDYQEKKEVVSSKEKPVITPIVVNGKTIATVAVHDRELEGLNTIEQGILQSMAVSTFWGTMVTVVSALIIGTWFSRRLTSPLRHMLDAISQIIRGDLKTRIHFTSTDEFGQVAQAFNEMTERLYRTEEARQHLVADVAHELRTPLTIMQGQLELIQQGVKKAEPETLLPIQDEVLRLTRLVQDLHQLSLAEVGKLPLEKKTTKILELIQRVANNFEIVAEDKEITISVQAQISENTVLELDPNRITQVFVNLLGNALSHTASRGNVMIEVNESEEMIRCSVQDTGTGISKEHIPYIFNRFYRAEEDRSRGTGGLGLGLAIAKEFVEAHKGRIEVTSIPELGTAFTVLLPKNPV